MSSRHRILSVLLTLLILHIICSSAAPNSIGDLDEDFAFELADDLEVEIAQKGSPKKTWGLGDVKATVGKIFHAAVPRLAKEQTITRFEAKTDDGTKPLPPWLLFDKQNGVFWGVPTSNDVATLDMTVKGYLPEETLHSNFKLIVEEEPPHRDSRKKCLPNEDYTILNLLIDLDLEAIKPKQKIIAINNIANFLGLPISAFYLSPLHQPDDLSDSSVILAGPGSSVKARSSKIPTALQVAIGCEGRIWIEEAPMVHQLKEQAREGIIAEVLRLPLIGWRVKTEMRMSAKRKRRNTNDELGSGDYFDDYDYGDDEYDEEYSGVDDIDDREDPKRVLSTTTTTTTKKPTPTTTKSTTTTATTTTTTTTTPTTTTTTTTTTPEPTTQKPTTTEAPYVPTVPHTSETHGHRHHHESTNIIIDEETEGASVYIPDIPEEPKTSTSTSTTQPSTTTKEPEILTEKIEIPKIDDVLDNYEDYDEEIDLEEEDIESETIVPVVSRNNNLGLPSVVEPETYSPSTTTQASTTKSEPDWVEIALPETTTEKITEPPTTTPTTTTSTTKQPTTTEEEIIVEEEITELPTTTIIVTTSTTEAPTTVPSTVSSTVRVVYPSPSPTQSSSTTESLTSDWSSSTLKLTTQQDDFTTVTKQTTTRHIPSTPKTTTEYIEYGVKNFPPNVRNRLDRIPVRAGKIFSYILPKDTFWDMEEGDDLKYEVFTMDREPLKKDSWLQFNPHSREFYGLPLDEDASRWRYLVVATDKEGLAAEDTLELVVQQSRTLYTVNHEFSLHLHVDKKNEFKHSVDWALRILQNIGLIYHQKNISEITIRKISYSTDPVVFTWTNESLPKNYCPKSDIDKLFNILTKNDEGEPSILLSRSFSPEFFVKKVTYAGLGVCEPQPQTPITPPTNFSPILRNPIDRINATVGELLVFRVPDDTFYDPEDQDSRVLKMTLLTGDRQAIPSHSWLQFDSKNREFYGIPMLKDIGEHEYHLVCEDSGGLPASDSLVVIVHAVHKYRYNVEFSMTLETSYESFVHSANMQRKFVEKLRDLFGDRDTNHIRLGAIVSANPTLVSWYNKSLPIDYCPRDEVRRLETVLVNNDRTISGRVQDVMDPEFVVSSIKLQLIGSCKVRPSVIHSDVVVPADETTARDTSDEYLITFIVPVVVVSIMLFIAGVGACVLYRRRRTGKMNVEEDGRSAFGNKGIPVIFQEELEEKPESGTKTPIILADEKPPLAPPEYSKSGSVKLTDDSEPYQPPPPFTRTQDNGRQSRPKHTTPTYRKPPPYVPP